MKYIIVKQYYNNTYDNFNNIFVKFVDFIVSLGSTLWTFIEIFISLFLCLYYLVMYIIYLLIFAIDNLLEAIPDLSLRRITTLPLPKTTKWTAATDQSSARAVAPARKTTDLKKPRPTPTRKIETVRSDKADRQISRSDKDRVPISHRSFSDFLSAVPEITAELSKDIKKLMVNLVDKVRPVKRERMAPSGSGLIDDYLKEYEQTKKA